KDLFGQKPDGAVSLPMSFLWAFLGLFIAYAAVMAAGLIELGLGITDPSENTESIMKVTRAVPLFMIIPIFCAPILEEIIFRKIIFGVFYKKTNFFIAALLSAVVFGFVHGEPIHILSYASMGFVFAYLYVRTKRLLVPILVHMALNSVTVIIQYIGIEKIEQKLESLQMILIGGYIILRISPRLPAFIYLVMAGLFFYSALKGSEDSADMFNFTTILLLL